MSKCPAGGPTKSTHEVCVACGIKCEAYKDVLIATLRKENERLVLALKEGVPILEQYIEEAGPCEHDVNICICDLIHSLEIAKQAFSK